MRSQHIRGVALPVTAKSDRCAQKTVCASGLCPDDGQPAPHCLLLRPESPYGRGALDSAIETAFIQVERLGCIGRQDKSASGNARQLQDSAATSVMLISPEYASECGPDVSDPVHRRALEGKGRGYILLMVVAVGWPAHNRRRDIYTSPTICLSSSWARIGVVWEGHRYGAKPYSKASGERGRKRSHRESPRASSEADKRANLSPSQSAYFAAWLFALRVSFISSHGFGGRVRQGLGHPEEAKDALTVARYYIDARRLVPPRDANVAESIVELTNELKDASSPPIVICRTASSVHGPKLN